MQTLERLKKMWDLHIRQRRFGITCERTCECESGWSTVFRKGDVLRDLNALPGKKRPSSSNQIQRVPRKRPRTESSGPEHAQQKGTARSVPQAVVRGNAVAKDASSVHTTKQGNLSNFPEQDFFRVSFDSRLPLGFHCKSEKLGDRKVCRVVSVDPSGECRRKSPLVRAGTLGEFLQFCSVST